MNKQLFTTSSVIIISFFAMIADSSAAIRLPKLFGNGMVLQRDATLQIWGWADPGERVQVRFREQTVTTQANRDGRWSANLSPEQAGGPDELTVIGKNTLTISDVLVGDVWLASGQSNMSIPLQGQKAAGMEIENSELEIDGAHFPNIRLLQVKPEMALKPKSDLTTNGWSSVTPETASTFSAVAYMFGRELFQRYNIPIGLIQSDYPGTPAEVWVSKASLKRMPAFRETIDNLEHVDGNSIYDYKNYLEQKYFWTAQHGSDDRGRMGRRNVWADPEFDADKWPTIDVPRPWYCLRNDFKGFGGTVWFRKEIDIPKELAGKGIYLHLGNMIDTDVSYFNGNEIGRTENGRSAEVRNRIYFVPGNSVNPGRNIIAVRLTGASGATGMIGSASYSVDNMYLDADGTTISLAGKWQYQPGPDLSELPDAPMFAAFTTPSRHTPTVLYNSMISPLTPYRIKGAIWYQGEANTDWPTEYQLLFRTLIDDWRGHWGYKFPFLFVQLAGFGHNKTIPADYRLAELREAQSLALSLPNTGMATAVDIGDENNIHPKNKRDVAHRLALTAAKVAYGENIIDSGPTYRSMRREGNRIRISFSNIGSGLVAKGKYGYVRGFEISSDGNKFLWAKAEIEGSDVLVLNDEIHSPIAVRYGWSNTPDGNLYNIDGLPAVPFRTNSTK